MAICESPPLNYSLMEGFLIKNWLQTEEGLVINLLNKIENENGFVLTAEL